MHQQCMMWKGYMNAYNKNLYKDTSVMCFKQQMSQFKKFLDKEVTEYLIGATFRGSQTIYKQTWAFCGIWNCFKCTWFNRNVNRILFQSTSPNRRALCLLIYICKRQFFQTGNVEMISRFRKRKYLAITLMQILVSGFRLNKTFVNYCNVVKYISKFFQIFCYVINQTI